MLEIKSITSGYGKKEVISDITATFKKGELVSIVGANGCGKSTLLKTLTGIIKATKGEILLDKAPLNSVSIAKRIAYLPQSKVLPHMTVGQLVLHGRFPYLHYPRRYSQKDKDLALLAMKEVGIDSLSDTLLSKLSGGMMQNAYIAMALCQQGDFILLDEPATYLDIQHQLSLINTLKNLTQKGKGIVTVMHDLPLAFTFSDKILVMKDGRTLAFDSPENVLDEVEALFGIRLKKENESYYYNYEVTK